jgi:hypothetical protein
MTVATWQNVEVPTFVTERPQSAAVPAFVIARPKAAAIYEFRPMDGHNPSGFAMTAGQARPRTDFPIPRQAPASRRVALSREELAT